MDTQASSSASGTSQFAVHQVMQTIYVPQLLQTIFFVIDSVFWFGRRIIYWRSIDENRPAFFTTLIFRTFFDRVVFLRSVGKIIHIIRIMTDLSHISKMTSKRISQLHYSFQASPEATSYLYYTLKMKDFQYVEGEVPRYATLSWPMSYIACKAMLIYKIAMNLLWNIFLFTYAIFELREAIDPGKVAEEEQVNRILIDLQQSSFRLEEIAGEMSEMVVEHKEEVNRVLTIIQSPIGADQIISTLNALSGGSRVVRAVTELPQNLYGLLFGAHS